MLRDACIGFPFALRLALVVVEFHVLVVMKKLLSLVVMDFEYDMDREC